MCGRYALKTTLKDVCAAFGADTALTFLPALYNVAPQSEIPVIVRGKLGLAKWEWPTATVGKPLINIRSESVQQKPSFVSAWQARRRCIVPASGFYEWDGAGQPYYTSVPNQEMIGFAGLWTRRADGIIQCAILTRTATPALAGIHPRMPVALLPNQSNEWFEAPEDVALAMTAAESPAFFAQPVSTAVNSLRNNDESLSDPLPGLAQGRLFG